MMPWPGLLEPFTECFGLGLLGSLCAAYLLGVNSFLFIVIFLLVHSAVWFFLDMSLMRTVEVWSSYHNCSTQDILPSPPLSHTHTHTHTRTHTHTHTEWSCWSTTSRVPGVVPERAMDISSLPSWHLEQRGGLEGPAIQATVWRKGDQTRLTGTDNRLYHMLRYYI